MSEKRAKVSELPQDVLCSLFQWLIESWDDYNSSFSSGSKKHHQSKKQEYWKKWAESLTELGYERTGDQIKKKINGDIAYVKTRLSEEKRSLNATGGGKKPKFSDLSISRKMLYDFFYASESVNGFSGGLEAGVKYGQEYEEFEDSERRSGGAFAGDDPSMLFQEEEEIDVIGFDEEPTVEQTSETPKKPSKKRAPPRSTQRLELADVATLRKKVLVEELKLNEKKQYNEELLKEKLTLEIELLSLKKELLYSELRKRDERSEMLEDDPRVES